MAEGVGFGMWVHGEGGGFEGRGPRNSGFGPKFVGLHQPLAYEYPLTYPPENQCSLPSVVLLGCGGRTSRGEDYL